MGTAICETIATAVSKGETSTKISPMAADSNATPSTTPLTRYIFPISRVETSPEINPMAMVEIVQGKAVAPPTVKRCMPPIKPANKPANGPPVTPAIITASSRTFTMVPSASFVPMSVP